MDNFFIEDIKNDVNIIKGEYSYSLIIDGQKWDDKTSYSRGENINNKIPSIFSLILKELTITIISGHRVYIDTWVFNCYELGIQNKIIKEAKSPTEAANFAKSFIKEKLKNSLKEINNHA